MSLSKRKRKAILNVNLRIILIYHVYMRRTKMMKKEKKIKPYDSNKKNVFKEFKAFISRGSVLDLAVGVIIGGAFNAIVTAVSKVLLSVATWQVPGGINGLVTVLPAANSAQAGMDASIGLDQSFASTDLQTLAESFATKLYPSDVSAQTIESAKTTILNNYVLHGTTYVYKLSATIDWGLIINATISFLIIALTLFIVVKVATSLRKTRDKQKAKWLEEYYQKYPELRPAPVDPGIPEPTDHEILKEMLSVLKKQNETDTLISKK